VSDNGIQGSSQQ